MPKIYKGHNSKITYIPCSQLKLCNCQVKEEYPMVGKCQTMDVVFDCSVTSPKLQKIYFGLTEGRKGIITIKESFNHKRHSHETTLSNYVWYLKEALDVTPKLKWSVKSCSTPYLNISKKCLLRFY